MAPVAVVLVLGGVLAGSWLARPRVDSGEKGSQVHVPSLPGTNTGGTAKPANPAAGSGVAPTQPTASEPKPATPEPKRPADSEAQVFVASFMRARMAGDAAKLAGMVAPGAPGATGIRLSSDADRMTAYAASLLGSGDPDSFVFRLSVAFASGQPGGEVAVETLRLTWKGGLKVAAFDEVANESLALLADKEGKLQLSRGQDTALVADLGALPAMAKPWGSNSEFGVGKEGWAVAAPSLTGKTVLWVTHGLHPLLGFSRVNWNGAPVVTPVDLLFEGGAAEVAWAPGSDRYVAVTLTQPSGATALAVYDVTGDRFGPDLSNVLGTVEYRVHRLRWLDASTLAFDLVKGNAPAGTWTYQINTRTLKGP
jgi:hypothetical protein